MQGYRLYLRMREFRRTSLNFVMRNDEVLQRTGLTSLSHLLSRRRISVFGHVARLDDDTPANVDLQLHVNVSINRPPDRTWRRPLVVHGKSGSISYETIPPVRLETSGGVLSTVDDQVGDATCGQEVG